MSDNKLLQELKAEVAELRAVAHNANDIESIRKLQHQYGYYLDKCLYQQVVDLFDDNGSITFHGGIYRGKPGLKRLYLERFRKGFTNDRNGPVHGFLLDHFQLQDIIDVDADRHIAKGRWRCFMQAGWHHTQPKPDYLAQQWWEHGIYENSYIRDPKTNQWKIYHMNYRAQYHADFESGWAATRPNYVPFTSTTYPEDPSGPDELTPQKDNHLWPDTNVVDFHYAHPFTGERLTADELSAPPKK